MDIAMIKKLIVVLMVTAFTLQAAAGEKGRRQLVSELFSAIDQADEMIVYSEGFRREFIIYRSSKREDFEQLKSAITLKRNGGPFICACVDGPEIALLKNNKEIAAVWNHEGTAIGSSVWEGDWETEDPNRWLQWFDHKDIKFPRESFNRDQDEQRKAQLDEKRWQSAMPTSLRHLWAAARKQYDPPLRYPDLAPLNAALAKQYPDKGERIRALMAWYGSGAGPWSGFPGYEEIAEKLLRQNATTALIEAVEGRHLTDAELEGAARILGGWTPVPDPTPIPPELRRILLEHCLKSSDGDKVERARKAFSLQE